MAISSITIVCGTKNLDGELVPTPLDEKNLTTDWLEEFLFDCNVAKSSNYNRLCGYVDLGDDDMLCEVSYEQNSVRYEFPAHNYIDQDDVDKFVKEMTEFFKYDEDLTIKVTWNRDWRIPYISVNFYSRCEE